MTYIFGHRGLPQIYRENSIKGLNKAFEYCDFVETDLRITKDKSIIFYHDSFIKGFFIQDLTCTTALPTGRAVTSSFVAE